MPSTTEVTLLGKLSHDRSSHNIRKYLSLLTTTRKEMKLNFFDNQVPTYTTAHWNPNSAIIHVEQHLEKYRCEYEFWVKH